MIGIGNLGTRMTFGFLLIDSVTFSVITFTSKFFVKDGYNGYLITNNQTQILAQKIISLLKNEELCKKIGKNARKTVEEKFSVDFFISNLTKVFNELMTR